MSKKRHKEQSHPNVEMQSRLIGIASKQNSDSPDKLTRRKFVSAGITLMGACYAGAIGYPVYQYLATPAKRAEAMAAITEVSLPDAQNLKHGSALMFKFGFRPAMLIHHEDGNWVAFDAVCSHLGCTVQFQPEEKRIHCFCHGGNYDMNTGKNISGPPPRPLKPYHVEVTDAQVIVRRV